MSNGNNSERVRLKELGNSKFEIAKNESDIRGWTVKNGQGRILGKVNDLLFDIESEKVLYIILDMVGNEMHLKERKVVLPIDIAEVNEVYHNLIYPGSLAAELTELPSYEKGKVSARIEEMVQNAFSSSYVRTHTKSDIKNIKDPAELHQNQLRTNEVGSQPVSHEQVSGSQTVLGVFEHSNQAQVAVEYLLDHGYSKNQLEISSRGKKYSNDTIEHDDHSITGWFKSMFGNDTDARTYSEAAKTGCVVTVHTSSLAEAERAAHVEDSLATQHAYKSRIIQHNH
jgi:hypothetical protein